MPSRKLVALHPFAAHKAQHLLQSAEAEGLIPDNRDSSSVDGTSRTVRHHRSQSGERVTDGKGDSSWPDLGRVFKVLLLAKVNAAWNSNSGSALEDLGDKLD